MPEPIKMPPPPLAPGQVEVKLGAKRYVLNVPEVCVCGVRITSFNLTCPTCKKRAMDLAFRRKA